MQIEAQVDGSGMLHANLPEEFRGNRVRVQVELLGHSDASQWDPLSQRIEALDGLTGPRRTEADILQELRGFRATG